MLVARRLSHTVAVCAAVGLLAHVPVVRGAGCPGSGQQSVGPDVICGGVGVSDSGLNDFANYVPATIGGVSYETFSIATVSCNLGDQPLPWFQPSIPSNDHPVIDQNYFRLKSVNGSRRFEQLAQGWVKYGFCAFAENVCCTQCQFFGDPPCGNHTYLGVGCSDPYTGSRNGGQSTGSLRCPKYFINPTTGVNGWPIPNPAGTNSTVWRRMHINVADLELSNGTGDVNATRYFAEGAYLHNADASAGNKNNNCSYRLIAVTMDTDIWHFAAADPSSNTTVKQHAGIRAWVDTDTTPTVPGTITRVAETDVTTPEDGGLTALVIVGAQATNLNNGFWHYEFAIQNINSDRAISSFAIPLSGYANITNVGFKDVDYWDGDGVDASGVGGTTYDGTDWTSSRSLGHAQLAWNCTQSFAQNQGANALRWGTMYNFRFDCDLAPAMNGNDVALINAGLSQFKPNGIGLAAGTIVPATVSCLRGDINGDGLIDGADIARFSAILVNGNSTATPMERCAGDVAAAADYGIGFDDLNNFANCVLGGGGC